MNPKATAKFPFENTGLPQNVPVSYFIRFCNNESDGQWPSAAMSNP